MIGAEELIGKMWDLANYVTGFAIAQIIAFLLALGTSQEFQRRVKKWWKFILVLIVVANFVYIYAVWKCYEVEECLRLATNHSKQVISMSHWMLFNRIFCIVAFNLFGCVLVIQHRWFNRSI